VLPGEAETGERGEVRRRRGELPDAPDLVEDGPALGHAVLDLVGRVAGVERPREAPLELGGDLVRRRRGQQVLRVQQRQVVPALEAELGQARQDEVGQRRQRALLREQRRQRRTLIALLERRQQPLLLHDAAGQDQVPDGHARHLAARDLLATGQRSARVDLRDRDP